jgi:hypothetical protein
MERPLCGRTFVEQSSSTTQRSTVSTPTSLTSPLVDSAVAAPPNGSAPSADAVARAARQRRAAEEPKGRGTALDLTAYGLVIASIYAVIGPLFFMSGKEKVFFAAPDGIVKMFSGTFVSTFPGTGVAWFLIGLVELVVVAGLVISLVRGEFLPSRPKSWLLTSIALSMFTYALVAFGDTITGQYDGTASLFTYFATSGVLLVLVLLMPPYRATAWLSSLTQQR